MGLLGPWVHRIFPRKLIGGSKHLTNLAPNQDSSAKLKNNHVNTHMQS